MSNNQLSCSKGNFDSSAFDSSFDYERNEPQGMEYFEPYVNRLYVRYNKNMRGAYLPAITTCRQKLYLPCSSDPNAQHTYNSDLYSRNCAPLGKGKLN